jgi:hypothetical protein
VAAPVVLVVALQVVSVVTLYGEQKVVPADILPVYGHTVKAAEYTVVVPVSVAAVVLL